MKKNNEGFTLVELIVVLVILAILAAVLVPMLLGYIQDAKERQYIIEGKSIMTSAQSIFTKIYGKNHSYKSDSVNIFDNGRGYPSLAACNVHDYGGARDIFALAGYDLVDPEPNVQWNQRYTNNKNVNGIWNTKLNNSNAADNKKSNVQFVCVIAGSYFKYANSTIETERHKAFTVYGVIYQPYVNSDVVCMVGDEFKEEWPFDKPFADSTNKNTKDAYKINYNGETITVQFYFIKLDQNNTSTDYKHLCKYVDDYFKNK